MAHERRLEHDGFVIAGGERDAAAGRRHQAQLDRGSLRRRRQRDEEADEQKRTWTRVRRPWFSRMGTLLRRTDLPPASVIELK